MNRLCIIALVLSGALGASGALADALSELNNEQAQRIRALTASQQGVLLPLDGALDPVVPAAPEPAVEEMPAAPVYDGPMLGDEAAADDTMETEMQAAVADDPVASIQEDGAAADALPTPPLEPAADQADLPEGTQGVGTLSDFDGIDGVVVAELGNPESIGPYRLWLASFKTVREAQEGWQHLAKDNRDVLGDLVPVIVMKELGESGTFFRLQAGPLMEQAQAETRCEALKSRSLYCAILGPDDG